MNILFLTLVGFESLQERCIFTDLLREFEKKGHSVYAISPVEKRMKIKTHLVREKNATILRLQVGNMQKTNILEKGLSTVLVEPIFKKAIKKYFYDIKFSLILYSTPPITFVSTIQYVKARDSAKTYLLLKDIFPQNALDLGMLSERGIKGLIYRYFRKKEKKLYEISDAIGCMSKANIEYILKHNDELNPEKVEICPNSIEVRCISISQKEKIEIKKKYGIPQDIKVFVYGGNLGKPQGISFLIDCLKTQLHNNRAFFFIVGDGTEYFKLRSFFDVTMPTNMSLLPTLPRDEFDNLISVCDIGMIFLDHRFTIPNFPSRLLSYLQAGLPVLACTDSISDIGKVITEGGFGYWCESNDTTSFKEIVNLAVSSDSKKMGNLGKRYLMDNYSAKKTCEIILKKLQEICYERIDY